jgi:hypothetical protein
MDLLNIKNLENSIKKKENTIKFKKYNFMEQINSIDLSNFKDEFEIIDYPYKNKNEKDINIDNKHIQNIKYNIINKNNNVFNSKTENKLQELKNRPNLNSSSVNSESLIEDKIDYLDDEDSLKISKKENVINLKQIKINASNKNNIKPITNKSTNIQKLNENTISFKFHNITTKNSKINIFRNDSFKTGTTGVSTIKKTKTNKKINLSEKKDSHLKNRLNKKFSDKYKDYKEFKNGLNKTYHELSKRIYSPEKIIQIYNNNDIKIISDCYMKNIKIKQTKGNITNNVSKNKRIIKRKVKFKKINLK